ncbi:hypothetical protein OEZ86_000517 [Tetradesmus obliquus]|nr:hypothetical protein OEZ86_000517 [Tetradesmus obliquus]
MKRIGIDVGGTNTDAALLCGSTVLATAKAPSTADTLTGVVHSLQRLQCQAPNGLQGVQAVMLGTKQFVNAVIEQKHLSKVFVVRLCGTATRALPPFSGMPSSLTQQISAGYLLASGGFEYDGTTETSPLQVSTDAATVADAMLAAGAAAAAVCGVHAPLNPCQELAFGQELQVSLQQRAPGLPVHITLSHKLSGRLGLLEREAAAAINASLAPLAAAVVPQYAAALQQLGLQVPLYITGNDGTLLSAAAAQEHPVLTFKSGPVKSVRGAAFLAGVGDALVCDIGGTTTDIGAVVWGMPRMCGAFVEVAGACTNFQMPDVTSFGLGGGSLVTWQQQQQQQQQGCSIGP